MHDGGNKGLMKLTCDCGANAKEGDASKISIRVLLHRGKGLPTDTITKSRS